MPRHVRHRAPNVHGDGGRDARREGDGALRARAADGGESRSQGVPCSHRVEVVNPRVQPRIDTAHPYLGTLTIALKSPSGKTITRKYKSINGYFSSPISTTSSPPRPTSRRSATPVTIGGRPRASRSRSSSAAASVLSRKFADAIAPSGRPGRDAASCSYNTGMGGEAAPRPEHPAGTLTTPNFRLRTLGAQGQWRGNEGPAGRTIGRPPRLSEVPPPVREAGDALLRVRAAPLNPADIAIAAGRFFAGHPEPPFVPGIEVGRDRRIGSPCRRDARLRLPRRARRQAEPEAAPNTRSCTTAR